MLSLAEAFPAAVREIGAVARSAAEAGDRRWRPHAAQAGGEVRLGRRKAAGRRGWRRRRRCMLRLRAGFGVGAKADLLAFLLSRAARRRP